MTNHLTCRNYAEPVGDKYNLYLHKWARCCCRKFQGRQTLILASKWKVFEQEQGYQAISTKAIWSRYNIGTQHHIRHSNTLTTHCLRKILIDVIHAPQVQH